MRWRVLFLWCASMLFIITGCSGIKPAQDIDSGQKLKSAEGLTEVKKPADTLVYKDASVDYLKYQKFLLEPVVIYSGEDHDFGSIPDNDRRMMADFIRESFVDAITRNNGYAVVIAPGPDVVRVKFTLIGMTRSTRSLQAVTLLNPVGFGINALKSASGGEGVFMGNVTIAAEFYDSQSNKLLSAFQAKRYPLPIDILNLIGEYDAARAGVKDIMEAIRRGADATHRKTGFNQAP